MKRKIVAVVLASLLLGFSFDYLFYNKLPGVSFLLYNALILVITYWLAAYYRQVLNRTILFIAPLVLFFSAMTFIRTSGFLLFVDYVFSFYLLLMVMLLALRPHAKLHEFTVKEYVNKTIRLPLSIIEAFFAFLRRLVDTRAQSGLQKHKVVPVVRGILLSLPFLLIFLLLFSSADAVFKRYVGSLFDFNIAPELIFRLLLIATVASLFVGAYTLIFTHSSTEETELAKDAKVRLGAVESSIVLGSVATLFLIFVLIQVTYLFGGERNVTSTGLTYADYARKGFFELIFVAVITLVLLLIVHSSALRQTLKQKVVYMWLSGLLIVEVLVIMLSAHKRLQLYEQTYGFTVLRLYSHLFIGWLAVIFGLLLIHIIRERRPNQFAFQVFLSIIAFLSLINLLNPDAVIARENIQRFERTGKIDMYYLHTLSLDAVPNVSQLLTNPNPDVQKSTASSFYNKYHLLEERDSPWQSFNVSRFRAKNIFEENADILNANKGYPISNDLSQKIDD